MFSLFYALYLVSVKLIYTVAIKTWHFIIDYNSHISGWICFKFLHSNDHEIINALTY